MLQTFFPAHIQVVFLLQPNGFFQRAFADFRSKFVKEELEFKVMLGLLFIHPHYLQTNIMVDLACIMQQLQLSNIFIMIDLVTVIQHSLINIFKRLT